MKDKIYVHIAPHLGLMQATGIATTAPGETEYIKKEKVLDAVRLAYGEVSKDPFDCSDAFEKLLNDIQSW